MNRRDFLKHSSLAGIASLLSFRVLRAADAGQLQSIRRGVGTFRKSGGTIGWLIHDDACVVIDSQFPENATLFLDAVKPGHNPGRGIDLLFNSHHHRDHTGGNAVLAPISRKHVAQENCVLWQRKTSKDPDAEVCAQILVNREWSAELPGDRITATYYGPAHTSGDLVMHFEQANVAHVGDLVFHFIPPYIDQRAGANIGSWIEVLETLNRAYDDDTLFIFGHASANLPVTGNRSDLLQMRDFLSGLLEYTSQALGQGVSREQLMETVRLPEFESYFSETRTDAIPSALGIAYDELTQG